MHSLEHKKYLRDLRLGKLFVLGMQVFVIVFLIVLWQVLANNGVINTFITSSPIEIGKTLISLYTDGVLLYHVGVTFFEVITSFVLGMVIGVISAGILWRYRFLSKVLDPFLTVLNSLPKVSLGPIIIIIAGTGTKSIILMALFISVIITIMDTRQAFLSTDYNKIKLMKSFKASNFQIFFKLVLPSNFNNIFNVIKVNLSLTFTGVIMGEFLSSKSGVGYLIMYGSQVFNLDLVITGIVLLAVMAMVMYLCVRLIAKALLKK